MSPSRYEQDAPEIRSTAGRGETFAAIMARRLSRRGLLQSGAAASALVLAGPASGDRLAAQSTPSAATVGATPTGTSLAFEAIAPSVGEMVVASGHTAVPFLAWGDPLTSDAAPFDAATLTAAEQATRVGYNHDFVGFLPLPMGADTSDHGLLVVNHEYTNPELMFPGVPRSQSGRGYPTTGSPVPTAKRSPSSCRADRGESSTSNWKPMASSSSRSCASDAGRGRSSLDSPYNRRITATTAIPLERSRRRTRPAQDECRRYRDGGPRHPQQLRGRSHAVGHLRLLRGEFPPVLRQPRPSWTRMTRSARSMRAWGSPRQSPSASGSAS